MQIINCKALFKFCYYSYQIGHEELKRIVLKSIKQIFPNVHIGDFIIDENQNLSYLGKELSEKEINSNDFKYKLIYNVKQSIMNNILSVKKKELEGVVDTLVRVKVVRLSVRFVLCKYNDYEVQLKRDELYNESLSVGRYISVLVTGMLDYKDQVVLQATRSGTEYVLRLMHSCIPELQSGVLEIKGIVRKEGYKTKVCVSTSSNDNDNAIRFFVGVDSLRLEEVKRDMPYNEFLEYVQYHQDKIIMLKNIIGQELALQDLKIQAEVGRINLYSSQSSLIVGRYGLNINLAEKIWGCPVSVHDVGKDS